MSYIGNSPALKYASFAVQHFTTSATTSYSLDNSVANENDIALFVNNVRPQPGSSYAYTAAGTTLPLSAATTTSDKMYCVFIGKAVQTVVPPASSVGLSQLSATGTASSSTFLRGDNAWTDPGGVALTGSTNNTVVTVTGADAIAGEAKLLFDPPKLTIGNASEEDTSLVFDGHAQDYYIGLDDSADDLVVGVGSTVGTTPSFSVTQYGVIEIPQRDMFGVTGAYQDNYIGAAGGSGEKLAIAGHTEMLFYNEGTTFARVLTGGNIYMRDDSDTGRIEIMSSYSNPQIILRGPATTNSNKMVFFNGNGEVGSIATSGSATAFNTSSDYRLKENETSITDGIDRIKQLKPYRFNFKTDATKTVDGFFAHEVSGIVPEAISGDKDAMHPEVLYTAKDELPEGKNIGDVKEETTINPQGIDQSKLVPLLTSALQEAITKIETLEAKVTALENA